LPHGYCTECRAQVTVRDGLCLLDHRIDPATIEETPGRRLRANARRRRGTHEPRPLIRRDLPSVSLDPSPLGGSLALLERERVQFEEQVARFDEPADEPRRPAPSPLPVAATPRQFTPVTDSDTLSLTGLLVEELWNLSPDEDILDWAPSEMDTTLAQSGMRARKVVVLVAIALAIAAVGWRALTWDDSRVVVSMEAVAEASSDLVTHLQALSGPVADLSDGTLADPLAASTALARLDESARVLFGVAGDMSTESDMAPVRELAIAQAAGALELGSIMSESIAYAAAVELITRPLELPVETDIDGLADVTQRVTAWVSAFQSGVQSLPGNDVTDTHRVALTDLAASLPVWQAAYLDSLRGKDVDRATAHVQELEVQVNFVRNSWRDTVASIAIWAQERIDTLAVPLVVNR
jgi:hypothetical protein